jgi:hypothetical protein
MASRGVLLKALFTQFTALTTELREMFPEDPDFVLFETALKTLEKTNPGLVLKYFKDNVLETGWSEKIAARDESFFLEYHYAEYQESMGTDVIGKLKQYWAVLSPESRTTVWEYLTALNTICTRLAKVD